MYHSIADGLRDPYAVSVDAFREQLSWLSENGRESISLASLVDSIKNKDYKSLNKKLVLTFDDGYRDFASNALPILLRHSATATVFLVTDMFGEKGYWSEFGKDVPLMTEDEARYIKTQGISLGSHTATHARLTDLNYSELHRQLRGSHDKLFALGETFYSFSYPWGQTTPKVVEAVKSSGYECAVGIGRVEHSARVDIYLMPRLIMRSDMNLKSFQTTINDYSIAGTFRRFSRALMNRLKNRHS
jgi:peptidoglycan/xylan/chitin deacetylase (PgdA/CDA1 family)